MRLAVNLDGGRMLVETTSRELLDIYDVISDANLDDKEDSLRGDWPTYCHRVAFLHQELDRILTNTSDD